MKNKKNQTSSTLVQEYNLTQAQYHGLVHGFETVMKFSPKQIYLKDSKLSVAVIGEDKLTPYVRALVQVDYATLIGQSVSMAFTAEKAIIKKAKAIRGGGNVRIGLRDGHYHIKGDHTGALLPAIPIADAVNCVPSISWVGTKVAGYDPRDVNAYIGKNTQEIQLVVYDDQLEQIWFARADAPYTFTAGMAERLAGRCPDVVLLSRVAFRFNGPKQALQLGKVGDQFVLSATSHIDIGVDLVVLECLDVVSSR